jgi:hypothetical protein
MNEKDIKNEIGRLSEIIRALYPYKQYPEVREEMSHLQASRKAFWAMLEAATQVAA